MKRNCGLLLLCACTGDTDTGNGDGDSAVHTGLAGDTGSGQTWDARFDPVVEAFQAELDATGTPGVAVAIWEGGELVFSVGLGTRDPLLSAEEAPVLGSTLFRIGSVTKMLTAAATLTEVDAGQLSLEQPVVDLLPDLSFALDDSWAPALRLDHLLTHQGGFYDWTPLQYGQDDSLLESVTYSVFDDYLHLMVEPGSFWNYANPNYSLVGLVGQTSASTLYRELLDERVLTPLGMDRTVFLADEVETDGDFAYSNSLDWTGETTTILRVEPDSYADAWSRPAGFAWSSAEELARFGGFMMEGDDAVLSTELREAMATAQISTLQIGDLEHYGYGLIVNPGFFLGSDWVTDTLWSHGGAIPGFSASLYILPEHDLAMAILASADGAYFGESVVAALPELVDLTVAEAPELWDESISLDDYVGAYSDPWNVGDFEVTNDGGQLQVSMPDLDALGMAYEPNLTPYVTDNYLFSVTGTVLLITFIRDESGTVTHFRNRYFVGERVLDAGGEDSSDSDESTGAEPALPRPVLAPGVDGLRRAMHSSEPTLGAVLRAAGD